MSRFLHWALLTVVTAALSGAAALPARAADLTLQRSFGTFGAGAGQFDHPLGAAVSESGTVWIVDALNDRVTEWDTSGAFARAFGATGTGRLQFRLPEDVAYADGLLYVSDCYGQRVQRIDSGKLAPLGEFTGGPTRLKCPQGLAVTAGPKVFVADTFNDRVVAYDPITGTVLQTLGGLARPRDVAVSPTTGDLYVTVDADDQCTTAHVARLAADGTPLGTFGTSGAGTLFCPLGVEVDAAGNVVVSDAAGRVNLYTATGDFAAALAPPPGAKAFAYPYGLATDAQCRVYIVERDAPAVRVYGRSEAPFCPALSAAPPGPPPPASAQGDTTPPAVGVHFPTTVSLRRASSVSMNVRCPFEACRVTAFGKVRVSGRTRWWMQIDRPRRHAAGQPAKVTLRFRRAKDLAALRRHLRRGRQATLELVVSAADAKGNVARKRVVRTLR